MKGSRQVFVKVVLFQLDGRSQPQPYSMPSFFPDSKSFILGLSINYHLFYSSFSEVVKTKKARKAFQYIWRTLYIPTLIFPVIFILK